MRYLIADVSAGHVVQNIYEDPPVETGSIEDALSNTLISQLDLAPIPEDEALQVLQTEAPCTFNQIPEADPILWANDGAAAMKLNGVLVALEADGEPQAGGATFSAPGTTITVRRLGEEADWRQNAELVFALDQGLRVASTSAAPGDDRAGRNP